MADTKTLREAAEVARILQSTLGATRDFSGLDECAQNTWDLCQRVMDAALAAQAQAEPVAVPDGYALVPVEPTPEMCRAANGLTTNRNRWSAMLAAAPKGGV